MDKQGNLVNIEGKIHWDTVKVEKDFEKLEGKLKIGEITHKVTVISKGLFSGDENMQNKYEKIEEFSRFFVQKISKSNNQKERHLKLNLVPVENKTNEELENISLKSNKEAFKIFGRVENVASGKAKCVHWRFKTDKEAGGIVSQAIYSPKGEKRRDELEDEWKITTAITTGLGEEAQEAGKYLAINLKKVKKEDVGIEEELLIESDLAEGDLETKLREKELPYTQRISLGKETIRGFKYLHKVGYVHGDIKPENSLVFDGHAKLSDFGKTKLVEDSSKKYQGNLRFGPPEQQLSKKGDVYGAALVLVRILEEPFLREDGTLYDMDPEYRKEGPVNEDFRGVEEFVVRHKKFLAPNKPGSSEGTLKKWMREGPPRITGRFRGGQSETRQIQEREIHKYIQVLVDKMSQQKMPGVGQGFGGKLSPLQATNLQDLLKRMTANNPQKRPTMEEVEREYGKIFPEAPAD